MTAPSDSAAAGAQPPSVPALEPGAPGATAPGSAAGVPSSAPGPTAGTPSPAGVAPTTAASAALPSGPRRWLPLAAAALAGVALGAVLRPSAPAGGSAPGGPSAAAAPAAVPAAASDSRPALSVSLVRARSVELARELAAEGDIVAWQEASLAPEANGLRLTELQAEVGDVVRRGQVLARFDDALLQAEARQLRAAVAEARAALDSAAAEASRARTLHPQGALSAQQAEQAQAAEAAARARLEAQRAALATHELRLARSTLRAPDDGVIAARSAQAAVGAVVPAGQELFRLIRQGRLEWRAALAAEALAGVRVDQPVRLTLADGREIAGRVRRIAPTLDLRTRNGRVDVALTAAAGLRAGEFLRGRITLGRTPALVLPQTAVLLRDGHALVHAVDADARVRLRRVETGRRDGEWIEITAGLREGEPVVAAGGGFLSEGDRVRVVTEPVPAASASAASGAPAAASR